MSEQDRNLERLLDAARGYNEPPPAPREAMWSEIRRQVWSEGVDGTDDALDLAARRAARGRRWSPGRWAPWALGLAAAAMLAVGFGLGRVSRTAVTPTSPVVARSAAERSAAQPSLPARLAAAEHMDQAEALLTTYRTAQTDQDRASTAAWARDLLSTTRLLLDSRVGQDPQMADLLSDLELVLVQIADAGSTDGEEQKLIEDGIDDTQLLPKLRAASSLKTEMAL